MEKDNTFKIHEKRDEFLEEIKNESPRAQAILAGAYLDDKLKQ